MAILKRAKANGFLKKMREALWPSMGWRRTFHYYRHRMFRTGDSAYKITAGLAAGAAICFTPFLGLHIIQAAVLAWLIRASLVAGIVGTAVGTPWTYPFMFVASYHVGMWLCGLAGLGELAAPPEDFVMANADHEPWQFFSYMIEHPMKVLLPLTVGGYVCAALSWPLYYLLLYYPVQGARAAYIARHRRGRGHKP